MRMDMNIPEWLRHARSKWAHTGGGRPDFAETPGPGQESVWDYPRPPAVVPDSRQVIVRAEGEELARTRRAVRILETASPPTFYIPVDDVRIELMRPASGSSMCEWKGQARYWALRDAPESAPAVAWSYQDPFPEFAEIKGHMAFYPARVDCTVAGEEVFSQPGGFYGGWITPEIVGPWKGAPGSGGW